MGYICKSVTHWWYVNALVTRCYKTCRCVWFDLWIEQSYRSTFIRSFCPFGKSDILGPSMICDDESVGPDQDWFDVFESWVLYHHISEIGKRIYMNREIDHSIPCLSSFDILKRRIIWSLIFGHVTDLIRVRQRLEKLPLADQILK